MNKENPLRLMCERESRKRLKTNKGLREQARAISKKVLGEQAREKFNHKRLNPAKNDKTKYMSINFSKGGTKEEREEKKKAIRGFKTRGRRLCTYVHRWVSRRWTRQRRRSMCHKGSREMKSSEGSR